MLTIQHLPNHSDAMPLRLNCFQGCSVAAAATPMTNDMQHISMSSRRNPALLCGRPYAQSNSYVLNVSAPIGPFLREERKKAAGPGEGAIWAVTCYKGKRIGRWMSKCLGRTRGKADQKYRPTEVSAGGTMRVRSRWGGSGGEEWGGSLEWCEKGAQWWEGFTTVF